MVMNFPFSSQFPECRAFLPLPRMYPWNGAEPDAHRGIRDQRLFKDSRVFDFDINEGAVATVNRNVFLGIRGI